MTSVRKHFGSEAIRPRFSQEALGIAFSVMAKNKLRTQIELCSLCGIDTTALSKSFKGKRAFSPVEMDQLARALGVTVDQVFSLAEKVENSEILGQNAELAAAKSKIRDNLDNLDIGPK